MTVEFMKATNNQSLTSDHLKTNTLESKGVVEKQTALLCKTTLFKTIQAKFWALKEVKSCRTINIFPIKPLDVCLTR